MDLEGTAIGSTGKLWLGGENASGDIRLLEDNGITIVQPAAKKPWVAETMQVKVLDYVDGTALVAGETSLDWFLERCDGLIRYMLEGHGVLSACKNGAHRSATETVVLVMRLTGWSAKRASAYVTQLRNLVDLDSLAPPSSHRSTQTRPSEFLRRNEARILNGNFGIEINQVLTPMQFRSRALSLGFSCRTGDTKTGLKPKAKPKDGSGLSSFELVGDTVSSHDVSMSSSLSSEDSSSHKRCRFSSEGVADGFLVMKDSLKTPEARAAKLNEICAMLTDLDAKLLGGMAAKSAQKPPEPKDPPQAAKGSERPPEPKEPPKSKSMGASADSAAGQVSQEAKPEPTEKPAAASGQVKAEEKAESAAMAAVPGQLVKEEVEEKEGSGKEDVDMARAFFETFYF